MWLLLVSAALLEKVEWVVLCVFSLSTQSVTLMWNLLSPDEAVKVEVVEDPCKCEARLAFQKQTQAAIQQLTAKHILFCCFRWRTLYYKQSAEHWAGDSWLFLPAGIVIEI